MCCTTVRVQRCAVGGNWQLTERYLLEDFGRLSGCTGMVLFTTKIADWHLTAVEFESRKILNSGVRHSTEFSCVVLKSLWWGLIEQM